MFVFADFDETIDTEKAKPPPSHCHFGPLPVQRVLPVVLVENHLLHKTSALQPSFHLCPTHPHVVIVVVSTLDFDMIDGGGGDDDDVGSHLAVGSVGSGCWKRIPVHREQPH